MKIRIKNKTLRFIEFLVVGVMVGMLEDVLAVKFATGERITFGVLIIIFFVALPFAFISEYLVDHPRFWKTMFHVKEHDEESKKTESSKENPDQSSSV